MFPKLNFGEFENIVTGKKKNGFHISNQQEKFDAKYHKGLQLTQEP